MTENIEQQVEIKRSRGRPKGSSNSKKSYNKTKVSIIPASDLKDITKEEILFNRLILIIMRTKRDLRMSDIEVCNSVNNVYQEVKIR